MKSIMLVKKDQQSNKDRREERIRLYRTEAKSKNRFIMLVIEPIENYT